jgi:flagellar biogenesis protein FliO
VSLGEKRFVAVIQIDGSQYLVGGGATNVALLAHLSGTESFQEMLKQTMTIAESQIENPVIEQLREKA